MVLMTNIKITLVRNISVTKNVFKFLLKNQFRFVEDKYRVVSEFNT